MIRVRPSFYDKFSCRASRCAHSCCVGWEIDIDRQSAAYYASVKGDFGRELRAGISEDGSHFILCDDGACPFLQKDGLCRIILRLGEEALCDICAEHPRFYNCYPGREESGLRLCCEEAVRLLAEERDPFSLVEEDDGAHEDTDPWREKLVSERKEIFSIVQKRSRGLDEAIKAVCDYAGMQTPPFESAKWAAFFLGLERMDESWTECLEKLAASPFGSDAGSEEEERYAKVFLYLLFRHFITANDAEEARKLLGFCIIGTRLIASLDRADPGNRDEHIRLFSAEIEYSDENVRKICSIL